MIAVVTIFGVIALTFMVVMYALERRHHVFVLAFAAGCGPVARADCGWPPHQARSAMPRSISGSRAPARNPVRVPIRGVISILPRMRQRPVAPAALGVWTE